MNKHDLKALLNQAAEALKTPKDYSVKDIKRLIEVLRSTADKTK